MIFKGTFQAKYHAYLLKLLKNWLFVVINLLGGRLILSGPRRVSELRLRLSTPPNSIRLCREVKGGMYHNGRNIQGSTLPDLPAVAAPQSPLPG
jgi:hypothetical protein